MQFDFGYNAIYIKDDERWRDFVDGVAVDLFEEAGADTESGDFEDFKYDVLEDVLIDVIQDALSEAADDDRLKVDNFKDFFDEIEG